MFNNRAYYVLCPYYITNCILISVGNGMSTEHCVYIIVLSHNYYVIVLMQNDTEDVAPPVYCGWDLLHGCAADPGQDHRSGPHHSRTGD